MRVSVVRSMGVHLPARVLTNAEIAAKLDTTDEWIIERTGIRQRHIAADNEVTSDLGAAAARQALARAQMDARDIDLIVCGTTTPDDTMPATAVHIQRKLGASHGGALDVSAACSGFVYALTVADSLLKNGQGRRALVIGAETYSRILDWNDRGTCILFGDGAGAMVLEAIDDAQARGRGILHSELKADGEFSGILHTTGGVSRTKNAGVLTMAGKEVFRHAVAKMSESIMDSLKATGKTVADIDWLVPHQANWRILASIAQKIGLPEEKVISTVANHANTSAASIPLALETGVRDGRIKQGQIVVLTALGSGLTWGSSVICW